MNQGALTHCMILHAAVITVHLAHGFGKAHLIDIFMSAGRLCFNRPLVVHFCGNHASYGALAPITVASLRMLDTCKHHFVYYKHYDRCTGL